jgi:ribose 5-phosphate isomerase RpiB
MASRLKVAQEKYSIPSYDIDQVGKISGKDHKYIDFVCKAYNGCDNYEDDYFALEDIEDAVKLFEKYKSKLDQKDLNKYSFKSLKDAISKLSASRKDLKNNDVNILYEDDTWKVVHPTTFESAALYSSNTKWCISRSSTYNEYNQIKLNKGSTGYHLLIIVINKLTSKKIGGSFYGATHSSNTNHYIELYDEVDNMIFSLDPDQILKYSKVLNKMFSTMDESNFELPKEDFSNLIFKESLLPFVQVNEKINIICNKFIAYLHDLMFEIEFNFDLKNKCYNLVTNKNSLLAKVYALESAHKILDTLKKHFDSELSTFDHIMKIHDKECKFLTLANKVKTKVAKKAFDFKSLESCDCNKFNNLTFLQELKKSIDKTSCDSKPLEDKKVKILSVVQNKIKFLDEFNKNRGTYLENLLKKDSKDINVDFVISKLNLSRDEALFLQVKSESSKVKNYCKSTFKVPDDFAKEMLALKNINNLDDLKV